MYKHGTDDQAAQFGGSQYFYDQTGSQDKTLKLYQGGYHDLLNDLVKESVISDIKGWINERLPAEASTASSIR